MSNNAFVDYLCELARRDDRGALAHLRRGLGGPPGTAVEMFPYVVPWLPAQGRRWQQDAHFLVAALFAMHPAHDPNIGSLGSTLRRLAHAANSEDSTERRFVALLNTHRDDLFRPLRHAVSLAKSHNVPVDYAMLLQHVQHWANEDRWVQRRWAADFWTPTRKQNDDQETDNKTTEED